MDAAVAVPARVATSVDPEASVRVPRLAETALERVVELSRPVRQEGAGDRRVGRRRRRTVDLLARAVDRTRTVRVVELTEVEEEDLPLLGAFFSPPFLSLTFADSSFLGTGTERNA